MKTLLLDHNCLEIWTFKIAENPAIAEKIQLTELSIITEFYCIIQPVLPIGCCFCLKTNLEALVFRLHSTIWRPQSFKTLPRINAYTPLPRFNIILLALLISILWLWTISILWSWTSLALWFFKIDYEG